MKIIIDCDPGNGIPGANVDDAIALTFALRHRAFDVRAVWTVFGNTSAAEGYAAAQHLLAWLDKTVPLRCGSNQPLSGQRRWWRDTLDAASHDPDVYALWGARQPPQRDPAAEPVGPTDSVVDSLPQLVDDLVGAGTGVILVCLGPLTNIARIIMEAPAAMSGVSAIHLMGGCLGLGQLVDTNFAIDPRAAEVVLNTGIPLTITPLDVTRTTELSDADWRAIRNRAGALPALDAMGSWLEPWLAYSSRTRPVNGMWLHDVVVLAHLAEPTIASTERVPIAVATHPAGKLVRDPDGILVTLLTGIDNRRLIALWEETLCE